MTISEPSLPDLKKIIFHAPIEGLTGYLYGTIIQTNPVLLATIFVVRCVVSHLFYQFANFLLGGKDLQSHKIFIATSTVVNMTFLIALTELNLVGRLFSCLLVLSFMGYLIERVTYIQDQERRLTEEESRVGAT